MNSVSDTTPDSKACQFAKCLRLIVKHSPDVIQELDRALETSEQPYEGGFSYPSEGGFLSDPRISCDCWSNLVNFEFISNGQVDNDMLSFVCENIENGICRHVKLYNNEMDRTSHRTRCTTTLLSAAVASGNLPVVKYFVEQNKIPKAFLSGFNSPVFDYHLVSLAAKNLHGHILKYMYAFCKAHKLCFLVEGLNYSKFLKRKTASPGKSFLIQLLHTYDITDVHILVYIFKIMCLRHCNFTLESNLVELVLYNAIEAVTRILASKRFKWTPIFRKDSSWQKMVTVCVLVDSDSLLQNLIENKVDIKFKNHQYSMMDVAVAFGSKRCVPILEFYMGATPNIYTLLSPYNWLLSIGESLLPLLDCKDLFKKCSKQGFDINATDVEFDRCPLHVALARQQDKLVKPLLELGSDVNCIHGGKTAIALAIDFALVKCMANIARRFVLPFRPSDLNLLKEILYYNPDPDRATNALRAAFEFDIKSESLYYVHSNTVIRCTLNCTTCEDSIIAETPEDRYMAVSSFALLSEFGVSSNDPYEQILQKMVDKDRRALAYAGPYDNVNWRVPEYENFRNYLSMLRSNPRSLKSWCRIAIRKAHPGLRLHSALSAITYPKALIDYITSPVFLHPTTIDNY